MVKTTSKQVIPYDSEIASYVRSIGGEYKEEPIGGLLDEFFQRHNPRVTRCRSKNTEIGDGCKVVRREERIRVTLEANNIKIDYRRKSELIRYAVEGCVSGASSKREERIDIKKRWWFLPYFRRIVSQREQFQSDNGTLNLGNLDSVDLDDIVEGRF
jgi:ribosomal protein L36